MIELYKVTISGLLGWPVAILVLGVVFNKSIRSFLERVVLFKAPGVELSAPSSTTAIEQTVDAKNARIQDTLLDISSPQQVLPVPEELRRRLDLVRAYGGTTPIVCEQMASIEATLIELNLPLDSPDTSQILIRHLAVTQLLHRAEVTYRLIFGSQIRALQLLQEVPQHEEILKDIYESARFKSLEFYGKYSFDEWIQFLIGQVAVRRDDNGIFVSTVYGSEFLAWMVQTSVPPKPH